jgi:hypothetical protein
LNRLIENVGQRRVGARDCPHRNSLLVYFERDLPFDVAQIRRKVSADFVVSAQAPAQSGACQRRISATQKSSRLD